MFYVHFHVHGDCHSVTQRKKVMAVEQSPSWHDSLLQISGEDPGRIWSILSPKCNTASLGGCNRSCATVCLLFVLAFYNLGPVLDHSSHFYVLVIFLVNTVVSL